MNTSTQPLEVIWHYAALAVLVVVSTGIVGLLLYWKGRR